jgi:hypothetical protein
MPHSINVFLGDNDKVNSLVKSLDGEQVHLSQGLSILFPTKKFLGMCHLKEDEISHEIFLTNEFIAMNILDVLKEYSHKGKLAYVETCYHGGTGLQAAILYEYGKQKIPAVFTLDYQNSEPIPTDERAINKILKEFGVDKTGYQDEFDSIGLGEFSIMWSYD